MSFVLKINCPDRIGIVADLSSRLRKRGCNIVESSQFFQPDVGTEREEGIGRFFMRIECTAPASSSEPELKASLADFANDFGADISIREKGQLLPTLLMVSRFPHCLQDILYRVQTATLPIKIVGVVSNHDDVGAMMERTGIPVHFLPVTKDNKAEQEARLDDLIAKTGAELVVLARYMQILSDEISSRYFGKIINIHHSFLPAFKGPKPYHRAWERGVKHIGATAHYVTGDLDEGPIIEQDIERVTHTADPEELVRRGRDIEARVLSRAIRLHAEDRVFLNGARTVVFQP